MEISSSQLRLFPAKIKKYSHFNLILDFMIALLPVTAFGVFMFGFRSLSILVLAIASALVSELLGDLIFRLPFRLWDGSAVITGWILGLILPATVPLWMPCLGAAFAILVVKLPFGGFGRNFLNPAVMGRLFLTFCFPEAMNYLVRPGIFLPPFQMTLHDSYESVLSIGETLAMGEMPAESVSDLIFGNCVGSIGTISVFFIALGLVFLLVRKTVTWEIPVTYLGILFLLCIVSPYADIEAHFALAAVCGSNAVFSAVFLAADPVTTPMSRSGKVLFGLFCAVMTYLIQGYTRITDAAFVVIAVANVLSFFFDHVSSSSSGDKQGKEATSHE